MPANVESMFYHGQKPWHGLGVPLDHPATAAEAIKAAGLDWEVKLGGVLDEDTGIRIPDVRSVIRTDRLEPLGTVGRIYSPVQNREAFSFCDSLVGEEKAMYETAGSLRGGRRIWLLAKVPGDIWVTPEDNVGKYLLLTNRHDGKSKIKVLFTPIRAVCENTLQAALDGAAGSGVSLRHVGNIQDKLEESRRVLGISLKYYDTWADQAKEFGMKSFNRKAAAQYFRELAPNPPKGTDPSRARATRKAFHRLFEVGKGNDLPSVRGTLWGAVNAVAEFVDHERTTRQPKGGKKAAGSDRLSRFDSAIFGSGASLKEKAWSQALTLIG